MGIHNRWMAIKLTIMIFSLVLGYFILLISQGALLKLFISNTSVRDAITYTRWGWIIALVFLAFGFIYKYAPAVEKKWKMKSPGTIIATSLSILSTLGFYIFVNNFGRYNVLYGSIGTIMVVMAVIYINSLALLIGFEMNLSINSLKKSVIKKTGRGKVDSQKTSVMNGLVWQRNLALSLSIHIQLTINLSKMKKWISIAAALLILTSASLGPITVLPHWKRFTRIGP